MLSFLNQNSGVFLVIFSFFVTVATIMYAVLTGKLVSETKKMRESQTEPNVFMSIQSKEEYIGLADLIIQNIGLGAAYNLKFEVEPDFELSKGYRLSEIPIIKQGIRSMPLNRKISCFLTSLVGRADELEKIKIRAVIKYENILKKPFQQEYILDFAELYGIRRVGVPALQEIAKNIEKIQEDIHDLMTASYPRISVITYTKKDMEEEHLKILEEEREAEKRNE